MSHLVPPFTVTYLTYPFPTSTKKKFHWTTINFFPKNISLYEKHFKGITQFCVQGLRNLIFKRNLGWVSWKINAVWYLSGHSNLTFNPMSLWSQLSPETFSVRSRNGAFSFEGLKIKFNASGIDGDGCICQYNGFPSNFWRSFQAQYSTIQLLLRP